MPRIALLRHGHTHWNREGRLQGRTDIPLDDVARGGLAALTLPPEWQDAHLWASPLKRAVETAQIVAGRDPLTDPGLIEMDWGDWEGQIRADLFADPMADYRDIETWGWSYTPPNGEPPSALRNRLIDWAETLQQDSVAVCHIGVMRVLLAHTLGWDFDGPAPFQIKRNRLYIIDINGQAWTHTAAPLRLPARAP